MREVEETLAHNLREVREKKGYTLKDVVKGTGYTEVSISRWETGTRIPKVQYFTIWLNSMEYL